MNKKLTAVPQPPKNLSKRANEKWLEVWEILIARGETDDIADVVVLYCDAWSTYCEAQAQLGDGKTIVKDKNDRVILNPWVAVRDGAQSRVESLGRALGLRPDNRLPRKTPPLSEFLSHAV